MTRRQEHEEIELLEEIRDLLLELVALLTPSVSQSTTAILSEQGATMSIPSGGSTPITVSFVDGTVTPPTPQAPPKGDGSGLVVTITTDNALVTIGAVTSSGDTASATATAGDTATDVPFNYSATVANASGVALLDDDGVTAFVQPAALASSVTASVTPPAQATTAVLTEG